MAKLKLYERGFFSPIFILEALPNGRMSCSEATAAVVCTRDFAGLATTPK
jgi:hypothetical protein